MTKYFGPNSASRLWENIRALLDGKYDKSGGEISGNVKVDGTFTLDIPDEDFDAGITFTKALDNNLGTVLTLSGYANGETPTSYRPIIRNIGTPNSNYDAATKKYVDDQVVQPTLYLVFLNPDGTVDQYASTLQYSTVVANFSNPSEADYLDVFWGYTRFQAKAIEMTDVNNGDIKFIGEYEYNGIQRYMVFTLSTGNVLTTTNIVTFESVSNKVQSVTGNSTSETAYPSTKAVYDEYQRKPVTVYHTDGTTGLSALETDMTASPSWQLTNLDLTPFSRIKIYTKAARATGSTANASTTPSIMLEMSLDPATAGPLGGHYFASTVVQKPNDRNRLCTLACAVSSDKTSFVVLRMTNLYGTAATNNADVGGYVVKIVGYYD